jgi:leucyl-tRNA synthetase
MAQLMSPMTPHVAEEMWEILGGEGLLAEQPWPEADPGLLVDDTVTLPVQVNGKKRSEITVPKDAARDVIEALAMDEPAVQRALAGAPPKKLIVVPGRIVNVVV